MELDKLDVRVLRELLQGQDIFPLNPDFRGSYRKIARKVGADKDVVRKRIARLHEDLIHDWHLFLNPDLLGLHLFAIWLEVAPSAPKESLVERLKLLDGVITIVNFFGPMLAIVLLCENEITARKRVELIAKIAVAPRISQGKVFSPECNTRLAKTDWDIIRTLDKNFRMSFQEIATKIGLSSRTVKRRIQHMIKETVLFGMPALHYGQVRGTIMTVLFVSYQLKSKRDVDSAIMTKFDDYFYYALHIMPSEAGRDYTTGFNLAVPNLSTAQRIAKFVEELEGVTEARIEPIEDAITLFENFPRRTEDSRQTGQPTSFQ